MKYKNFPNPRWFLMGMAVCCMVVAFAGDVPLGNEACLECHDDLEKSLHATVHRPEYKVSCTACHGSGEEHIEDPLIENIGAAKGAPGAAACLSCHDQHIHPAGPRANVHARASIHCNDCHSVHRERPFASLLRDDQTDLCLSCHKSVATMLRKPYTHHLGHGGMSCTACHDPHGGRGGAAFAKGLLADTCTECHTDKRGPFVFPHVTDVSGDCLTCHEVHGSSNPAQLTRARVGQLCLECHSTLPPTALGSQPPATHNLRLPRYQNCNSCHTAVHGSSKSPTLLK